MACLPIEGEPPLSTIPIHYDGWLSLPDEARRHLRLVTGSELEVELADGVLILRPASSARAVPALPAAAAPEPIAAAAEPAAAAVETAAPKRGRPRRTVVPDLAPRLKVGGRRKSSQPDQGA